MGKILVTGASGNLGRKTLLQLLKRKQANQLVALVRDPEKVKEDVLDEIVSVARARDKYGVVLTGSLEDYDIQVDVGATRELRKTMAEESGRVNGLSDRH